VRAEVREQGAASDNQYLAAISVPRHFGDTSAEALAKEEAWRFFAIFNGSM
jgi:hypothetical protein